MPPSSSLPSSSSITSLFASSAELSRLLAERLQAQAALESSPLWIAWSAAVNGLPSEESTLLAARPSSPPALTPKEALALAVCGFDSWDLQDSGVSEYVRASQLVAERRRVDELMQQLENSAEWRALVRLDHELKVAVRRESHILRSSLIGMNGDATVAQGPALRGVPSPSSSASSSVDSVSFSSPSSMAATISVSSVPVSSTHMVASSSPAASSSICETPVSTVASSSPADSHSSTPSSSSASKDPTAKLKAPAWCTQLISDPYDIVPERGLGLTSVDVYQGMCGSERHQVQRVWCARDGHSALAALVRALDFHLGERWQHPSASRLDEARQRLVRQVSAWTDDRFASVVPSAVTRSEYVEKVLSSRQAHSDVDFLYVYRATTPWTPRIYVITVHKRKDSLEEARTAGSEESVAVSQDTDVDDKEGTRHGVSLQIIGDDNPQDDTRCIILYQNLTVPHGHFEAVGWKKARGPSALRTMFQFSEPIITSLETWNEKPKTPSLSIKKRPRETASSEVEIDDRVEKVRATTGRASRGGGQADPS